MNGSFRLHVFAGDYEASKPVLKALDEFISSPQSFVNVHRPAAGVDSSIVNSRSKVDSRHIEADTRDAKLNPFFVSLIAEVLLYSARGGALTFFCLSDPSDLAHHLHHRSRRLRD